MKRIFSISAAAIAATIALAACGGGGGGGGSANPPTIVPTPVAQTPVPVAQTPAPPPPTGSQSLGCPSSGPSAASAAVMGGGTAQELRRAAQSAAGAQRYVPGMLIVSFRSEAAAQSAGNVASVLHARVLRAPAFAPAGSRVLAVDPAQTQAALAQLRSTPGVTAVQRAQYRFAMSTVDPNDPYYRGFGTAGPYYETATSPGQWDMHIINLGTAWGYYSTLPARGAAIAVIDTGVDVTHHELSGGRVIRQYCYVTYPAGTTTSGPYAVDTNGHGTNVAGIADADTNNSFGFAGVAYDAPLLAYRIFPTTPSGGCENSSSAQCSTTDVDEVNAINDAIAHGAKVINLSLGATGPLDTCKDTLEYNAIEQAIAKGVVVVAAAGNEQSDSLDCPAAYPGVIAVGAEGLVSGSSGLSEAVAGYSNWTSASGGGGGGVYLVAPGGTAQTNSDTSDLDFVENITSSEMSGAASYCTVDFAGATGDCRGGFSGTSQATPHVAGVVSLMLGLRPNLSPVQVASDLCSSAHNINDPKQGCGRLDAAAAVAAALKQ